MSHKEKSKKIENYLKENANFYDFKDFTVEWKDYNRYIINWNLKFIDIYDLREIQKIATITMIEVNTDGNLSIDIDTDEEEELPF